MINQNISKVISKKRSTHKPSLKGINCLGTSFGSLFLILRNNQRNGSKMIISKNGQNNVK